MGQKRGHGVLQESYILPFTGGLVPTFAHKICPCIYHMFYFIEFYLGGIGQ